MKILVTLAVVALLVVAAILYFGSGDLDVAPKKTATAPTDAATSPAANFGAVSALLAQEMSKIPTSLDAPRAEPVNAFSTRARLGSAAAARPEYGVLAKACDLIIYADQEHSVRQRQDQLAQHNVSGNLMANAATNQAATTSARETLHTRAQADWEGYRRQTDAEVRRLLASLPGARP